MTKVTIYFDDEDHEALNQLAEREYRTVTAQAAIMIHRQLQSLGLISAETLNPLTKNPVEFDHTIEA